MSSPVSCAIRWRRRTWLASTAFPAVTPTSPPSLSLQAAEPARGDRPRFGERQLAMAMRLLRRLRRRMGFPADEAVACCVAL